MANPKISLKWLYPVALMVAAPVASPPAFAWDGTATFKITKIDTTDGNNYAFRIYGPSPMCGAGSGNWAYMNTDWSNYQATAALITTAWIAKKEIILYSMKDQNGACKIGYVTFT